MSGDMGPGQCRPTASAAPLLKYAMQPFLRHPVPCHVPPPHPCVYPLCSRRNRFDRFAIFNLHHLLHPCEDRVDETLHLLLGVFGMKYDPESALARRDNWVLHRKHAKRLGQQVEVEPPGILLLRRNGYDVREKRTVLPTVRERDAEKSSRLCRVPQRVRGKRVEEKPREILYVFLCLRDGEISQALERP